MHRWIWYSWHVLPINDIGYDIPVLQNIDWRIQRSKYNVLEVRQQILRREKDSQGFWASNQFNGSVREVALNSNLLSHSSENSRTACHSTRKTEIRIEYWHLDEAQRDAIQRTVRTGWQFSLIPLKSMLILFLYKLLLSCGGESLFSCI